MTLTDLSVSGEIRALRLVHAPNLYISQHSTFSGLTELLQLWSLLCRIIHAFRRMIVEFFSLQYRIRS